MFRKLFTWLALGSLGLAGCSQRSDDASLRNRPAGNALPPGAQTLPADWPTVNPRDTYFSLNTRYGLNDKPEYIEIWAMGHLAERLSFHENGQPHADDQMIRRRQDEGGDYEVAMNRTEISRCASRSP